MDLTLEEIIELLVSKVGEVNLKRSSSKPIKVASSASNVKKNSVVYLAYRRWREEHFDFSNASCVITDTESFRLVEKLEGNFSIIVVKNPRLAFLYVLDNFFTKKVLLGIHATAEVAATADIHPTVSIGAFTFVGENCVIGAGSAIESHCVIGNDTVIGENCYIAPGVKIGQPGFGYERLEDGRFLHIPHIGGVSIGDDVHIGANTAIDRGTLDDTRIHNRVIIDNLCHISHNVIIESDCAIVANCMISGSAKIGRGSWIAPSTTIRDTVSIAPGSTIGIGSVVAKPIVIPGTYMGSPAQALDRFKKERSILKNLADEEIDNET